MKINFNNNELVCDLTVLHHSTPPKYKCVDKHGNTLYHSYMSILGMMNEMAYTKEES